MNETTLEDKTNTTRKSDRGGKYLTFVLGNEEYGLEILKVREIIGAVGIKITSVPQVPEEIKGVLDLRGSVIPIIDLRMRFDMPEKEYSRESCVIVLNVSGRLISIAVDAVSEVLDITEKEIDDPPQFGSTVDTGFIIGMGKVKDKVVMLLNIDKVLAVHHADFSNIETVLKTDNQEEE